jgi:ABC-type lipopolysaccharide export system ATPase subunit
MTSIIRSHALSKRFRRTVVLDGLDLEVPPGSIYGLVGPNGVGKTTTIKVLMNIFSPSGGSSEVLEVDSRRLGPRQFEQIGYVSENQELPDWMTVGYFLEYLAQFYPTWDRALAADLVHQFQLPQDRKLRHLSRGMKMKAALASSLAYRVRSGPMHMHAQLALTLLSPQQTTLLTLRDGPQAIPNNGFCLVRWGSRFLETNCLWPGRLPACLHVHLRTGREIHEPEMDRINSYARFPTWGGLWQSDSPYLNAYAPPLGADLVTRNAVAHFERDLDIPDLRKWTNR